MKKENEISDNFLNLIKIVENLRDNENLKYLDFSVNVHEGFSPSYEIQTVNKLIEYKDGALFNQTNLRSHSGETTLNFGVGKRKLLNDDTFLLGSNLFLDYQFLTTKMKFFFTGMMKKILYQNLHLSK